MERLPCKKRKLGHHDDTRQDFTGNSSHPGLAHVGLTTYDAKDPDTKFPPIEQLRPPKGAPNVLVILIDDCGFGATSAFGGPIPTPNAERLAANGLKFNRFHTTAQCSPTRQACSPGAITIRWAWAASPSWPPRPRAIPRCCRRTRRRWP